MNTVTWKSIKSPIMQEIRLALKCKAEPGKPTMSRREANRVWREDILGIRSEDQKKEDKTRRQSNNSKVRQFKEIENEQT